MVMKKFVTGILKTNTYVLWNEKTKKGFVIDPGSNVRKLLKTIREEKLQIEYIFNTHYHADHTNGNRKLKKATGATIVIHYNDSIYLRKIFDTTKLLTFNFSLSPKPDLVIKNETSISIGSLKIQIYHTPGHTPGGVCFYFDGLLFTGDTLFVGDSGATSFKGGDRQSLGRSLRRIMSDLPGNTIIYPGHNYGPTETSTLDWEKRNNKNAKEYGYFASANNDSLSLTVTPSK